MDDIIPNHQLLSRTKHDTKTRKTPCSEKSPCTKKNLQSQTHFFKTKANKSAVWRRKPQQNYIQTSRFLFC